LLMILDPFILLSLLLLLDFDFDYFMLSLIAT